MRTVFRRLSTRLCYTPDILTRLPSHTNILGGYSRRYSTRCSDVHRFGNKALVKYSYIIMLIVIINIACFNYKFPAQSCGIIGYVGPEGDSALPYLLEGLDILQNRGYDSAGVCTLDANRKLCITKYASTVTTSDCLDLLKANTSKNHLLHTTGIGHTRWASHGGRTDKNAHPHSDYKNRICLVHNGTIQNSVSIKNELLKKGIPFKSETDSEVIVQLISSYMDLGYTLKKAFNHALNKLEGTWGVCLIATELPDSLMVACHGSPLVIGIDDRQRRVFVASEVSAFAKYTSNYIVLEDGEIATISRNSVLDLSRMEKFDPHELECLSPQPYPTWTLKEIYEQPEAISRTLGHGTRCVLENAHVKLGGLDTNKRQLLNINNLLISGCGTSLYAGMYGAKILQSLKVFNVVHTRDAGEVSENTFSQTNGGLLVLSQSGETKDTHRVVKLAEHLSIPQLSIVNKVGSLIARSTKVGIYLHAGREVGVASTKSFTTQVTAMALLAIWYAQNKDTQSHSLVSRHKLMNSLQKLPTYIKEAINNTRPEIKEIAKLLKNKKHLYILGKGFAEPIAYEGALKLKELAYIHAEGFSGGALKHGPFALLEKGSPIILFILNDKNKELMKIAAREVKGRGAYNIVITDIPEELEKGIANVVIPIPSNGDFTALLGSIPLQLLAYELSIVKGINPDKPRNLAKAVTVD